MTTNRQSKRIILACLVFLIWTIFLYRGILPSIDKDMIITSSDTYLAIWIALWNCHILETNAWFQYWKPNALYPYQDSLSFSENLSGFTPFFCSTFFLSRNPVLTYNIFLILFSFLTPFILYICLLKLEIQHPIALFLSLIYGFYPLATIQGWYRIHWRGYIFFPILLYLVMAIHTKKETTHFLLLILFFGWTSLLSLTHGVLSGITLILFALYTLLIRFYDVRFKSFHSFLRTLTGLLLGSIVILPFILVYLKTHQTTGIECLISDVARRTPSPLGWLTIDHRYHWFWSTIIPVLPHIGYSETALFPGIFGILMIGCALFHPKSYTRENLPITLTLLTILLFIQGPYLNLGALKIPLPFYFIWKLFPFLHFIRVPARWSVYALVLASFLTARHLKNTKCSLTHIRSGFLLILLLFDQWLVYPVRPGLAPQKVPPVYETVKKLPDSTILLEYPLLSRYNTEPSASFYQLLSIYHWKKIVNGISGFDPALRQFLKKELALFPTPSDMTLLKELGVTHILYHTHLDPDSTFRQPKFTKLKELIPIARDAHHILFSMKTTGKLKFFQPHELKLFFPKRITPGWIGFALEVPGACEGEFLFNPYIMTLSQPWKVIYSVKTNSGKVKQFTKQWLVPPVWTPWNCRSGWSIYIPPHASSFQLSLPSIQKTWNISLRVNPSFPEKRDKRSNIHLSIKTFSFDFLPSLTTRNFKGLLYIEGDLKNTGTLPVSGRWGDGLHIQIQDCSGQQMHPPLYLFRNLEPFSSLPFAYRIYLSQPETLCKITVCEKDCSPGFEYASYTPHNRLLRHK